MLNISGKSRNHLEDTGIEIGEKIINKQFTTWDLKIEKPTMSNSEKILIFVSVYCIYCIDLLPYLNEIKKIANGNLYLFSSGEKDDHQEMVSYFKWEFPVIEMKIDEMKRDFKVTTLPFAILTDSNNLVYKKGIIYNYEDFNALRQLNS